MSYLFHEIFVESLKGRFFRFLSSDANNNGHVSKFRDGAFSRNFVASSFWKTFFVHTFQIQFLLNAIFTQLRSFILVRFHVIFVASSVWKAFLSFFVHTFQIQFLLLRNNWRNFYATQLVSQIQILNSFSIFFFTCSMIKKFYVTSKNVNIYLSMVQNRTKPGI